MPTHSYEVADCACCPASRQIPHYDRSYLNPPKKSLKLSTTTTASSAITNFTIQANTIGNNVPTTFFSHVFPVGSWSISGTLTFTPVLPGTLQSFVIYTNTSSAKNALTGFDFAPEGLVSLQNIPFTLFYESDGYKSLDFIFQGIGGSFSILSEPNSIQSFKIPTTASQGLQSTKIVKSVTGIKK